MRMLMLSWFGILFPVVFLIGSGICVGVPAPHFVECLTYVPFVSSLSLTKAASS